MQSLHPHIEGSPNEKRVIRFIEERLTLLRIPVVKTDFSKAVGGHSFSKILEATISGRSRDTLILAIPLNHASSAPSAEDGSFGIALGLHLLEDCLRRPPPLTVKMVFLGGEYENGGDPFLGTQLFLRSFYPVERHALLYLNLKSFPAPAAVRYGGRGTAAPLWQVNAVLRTLEAAHMDHSIPEMSLLVYRTGLEIAKSPIEDYLTAGIPAVGIETVGLNRLPLPEQSRAFAGAVRAFIDSFPDGLPGDWDRHFIFLSLPFLPPLIVSETALIVFLIAFLLILLVAAMFKIPQLKKYGRTLKRSFWNLPFFLAASFVILLAATFVLEGLLAVKNFPTLWTYAPALFFFLKLCLFLFAGALLYRIARRFPFSKNGSFYTAAALFFTVVCITIVACFNISFVHYFLWPLLCIIGMSLCRSKRLKVLFCGLSPLPLFILLIQMFSLSEPKLIHILLFNRIWGNLLFTVLALPYLLLLIRLRFLFPYRRASLLSSKSFLFMSGALAAALALGIAIIAFFPFRADLPQPVLAEQIIDFDRRTHTLSLSSPAPLGDLEVFDKTGPHPYRLASRHLAIDLTQSGVKDYVSFTSSGSRFSSRKNIDLLLECAGEPYKIIAVLSSDAPFKLYDSNFPAALTPDGRYQLSIGINPPPRLKLELTLPVDRSYTLAVEVLYKTQDADIDIHGAAIALERRLTFKKVLSFSS